MKLKLIKTNEFKIFLIIWLFYIFFLSDYSGDWMSDSILHGSMALVDHGNFITTDYLKDGCKQYGCDEAFYNGNFYPGFAPGAVILGAPVYSLQKFLIEPILSLSGINMSMVIKTILLNILSTIFITALLSALTSALLYKLLGYFTKKEKYKLLLTALFAFGTIFFIYSTGYHTRIISGFFLLLSFYLLFKYKKEKQKNSYLFLAGLAGASAVAVEYTTGLIFILISIYLLTFLRNKKIIYYILGALIPLTLLLGYHYINFENPLKTAYDFRANQEVIDRTGNKFFTSEGFNPKNIYIYFLSPERGMFFFSPFLLFSLLGLYYGIKKKEYHYENLLILFIILAHIIYLLFMGWSWEFDGSFGPRYLTAIIPFLILPLVFVIDKWLKPILALGIISVFFNFLGVLYDRTGLWTSAYSITNPLFNFYIPTFFQRGLTNYTFNIIKYRVYDIPVYLINLIMILGLIILGLIIYYIWKK